MFTATLSIKNSDEPTSDEYKKSLQSYVRQLESISELSVDVPTYERPNTRGELFDFSNIVLASISSGTFIAVYTLARDIFDRYANAEVTLSFPDGSSIDIKHLTYQEAEKLIRNHLKNNSIDRDSE